MPHRSRAEPQQGSTVAAPPDQLELARNPDVPPVVVDDACRDVDGMPNRHGAGASHTRPSGVKQRLGVLVRLIEALS